ncbi:MAG: M28 family peptidase, partial [Acidobacteria bacterium]|nr:M28 family peptidase [Acidobacteriota bacterium]
MDRQTKRLVVGSAALALVGWLVSPLLASRASEMIAIAEAPIHFNAARAIDLARQFVARFPSRALGSIEARQSTGFFREVLEPLGYSIEYTHFDATVEGRRQVGRNVLARRPGRLRETVAVVAHYDTTRTAVEGASDNGAAVGVLLELARVFSEETPQHSLLFLASDGGQWGMLGAADLAAGYPGLKDIVAAVSLDGISPGEIDRLSIGTDGLAAGYAPPWLRSLARSALLAEGPGVSEAFGLREHVERAFLLPGSDQGPLLARGIPAVNLDSLSSGRGRMARALLSSEDTIDQIRVATVEKFGRASERLLRSLDTLDPMPDDSMGAFQVIPGRYLSPGLVVLLQGVCFLPFLLAMRGYWREHNDRLSFELIRWETSWYLATWAPFLVAYGALLISYRMGLLPQFDLYPPPPGDPVMENPSWGIVAIILLSGIVSAAVFYLLGRLLTRKITK